MIYAIPNDGHSITNHFMKAPYVALYCTEDGALDNIPNPASQANANCQSKSALLALLHQRGAEILLVRNIGQRALAKWLKHNKRVYRVEKKAPIEEVLALALTPLTDAGQGRPSLKHRKKGGCGAGCHATPPTGGNDSLPVIFKVRKPVPTTLSIMVGEHKRG